MLPNMLPLRLQRPPIPATWPLLLLLLLPLLLPAQPRNFLVYSVRDGLPQSQVFALWQDHRGYLWCGTQGGGLGRFDGRTFESFNTGNGLPSNYVNAIGEDADAVLWAGTSKGACFGSGNLFVSVSENPVYAIFEKAPGNIWLGTDQGILEYNKRSRSTRKVAIAGMPERSSVLAFYNTPSGVWIATNRGVWLYGATTRRFTSRDGLAGDNITAFTADRQGLIWMSNWTNGISVIDPKKMQVQHSFTTPNIERALCLYTAVDGKIWVGTEDHGIQIYNPADSSWTGIGEREGLPHNHIRAIRSDLAGNIWVATSGGGLVQFPPRSFVHYSKENGLPGNRVYALAEDTRNRIWLAPSQAGLLLLDSTGFHTYTLDSGYLAGVKCKTLAVDEYGRLWVGTEGRGVAVLNDSTVLTYLTTVGGLPSNRIQKIVRGLRGEMWVATATGGIAQVVYSDERSVSVKQVFGTGQGLPDLQISTLQRDWKDRIWFGTQSGHIGCLEAGKVANVLDQRRGLPGVPVRSLAFSAVNELWAGTKGAGVYRARVGAEDFHFEPVRTPQKMASDNVYLLVFDRAGSLWVGTETGVDQLVFNKNLQVAELRHFGINEGFTGIETCHDAAICDQAGNLWFGTMDGLMQYIPTEARTEDAPPRIHFEKISLFYKPLSDSAFLVATGGGSLLLSYAQNHLSFDFRALDLARSQALQYHWRLEGAESEWSPLTTQRSVNYANLPPGRYVFWVQACSDDACSEPVRAVFVIKAPFWQNFWFQLALGLALGLAVFALVKNRIRKIRAAEQARREHLEMRNHLLQLEQKALQLQMNPHFIFNALNSIQSLVSTGDGATARQKLGDFARLMRSILNNSRQKNISLKEESEMLEQYLRVEQFCQQNNFDFSIHLPDNVDATELELPPMLLQPFVENAVVHGVSHLKYPGKIDVTFRFIPDPTNAATGNGILECCIRDNGVGRERAALLRQERKPGHISVAVEVTRERLEALRNDSIYPTLEYLDLMAANGDIAGTQVIVRIPANLSF